MSYTKNYMSYHQIKAFLHGKNPLNVADGVHSLVVAIKEPRVFLWETQTEGSVITNFGALRFVHATGEVYDTSNRETLFIVPKEEIPKIISAINARKAQDNFKSIQDKSTEKIFSLLKSIHTKTK